ncbi:hypothetical protein MIR68_000888 [Amoeboaphelidium protococcarum]|nr:hypothetical protein MIR68_000888 [Amoeboaphelidium protococcarum]
MNQSKDFPDGDIAPEDDLQNDTTTFIDDASDSSDDFENMQDDLHEKTVRGHSCLLNHVQARSLDCPSLNRSSCCHRRSTSRSLVACTSRCETYRRQRMLRYIANPKVSSV